MAQEIKEEQITEELKKMEYEPWLPVESKLVWGSIALGLILLLVLIYISYTYFTPSS